jgi:UDP-3-O-[3-hydroxymyristoyl] glucosamine N-acyltransferase
MVEVYDSKNNKWQKIDDNCYIENEHVVYDNCHIAYSNKINTDVSIATMEE